MISYIKSFLEFVCLIGSVLGMCSWIWIQLQKRKKFQVKLISCDFSLTKEVVATAAFKLYFVNLSVSPITLLSVKYCNSVCDASQSEINPNISKFPIDIAPKSAVYLTVIFIDVSGSPADLNNPMTFEFCGTSKIKEKSILIRKSNNKRTDDTDKKHNPSNHR